MTVSYTLNILLGLCALTLGICGYWIIEPVEAIVTVVKEQTQDEFGNPKTQFAPGETIYTRRTMHATRDVHHTKAWRAIVCGEHSEVVLRDELLPVPFKKGDVVRTHRVPLPLNLRPGKCGVHVWATYALNPMRDGTYEILPELRFEAVLPKPVKKGEL